ncbi:uncharacterized protein [Macrobrachium rosenbergii]|uniref:uncharacterized protein n=1 Tax=Macrobrachium rosenbergii TaxID=79674 RepID=UPI0034D6B72D
MTAGVQGIVTQIRNSFLVVKNNLYNATWNVGVPSRWNFSLEVKRNEYELEIISITVRRSSEFLVGRVVSATTTTTSDPRSLITEDNVRKVLKVDKGSEALLKSWKVVDFTKSGDNFACLVTSVEVTYSTRDEGNCEASYVVKLNPNRKSGNFREAEPFLFEKEGKFYEELVPALNGALASARQEPLRFPKCFLVSLEEEKEHLYFEDLRVRGFRMFDKKKGLDKSHVTLVISELARLHGASYLLKQKFLEGRAVTSKYEFLSKDFLTCSPNCTEIFVSWVQRAIDTGVTFLETVSGYETATAWVKSIRSKVGFFLSEYLQSKKFNSVCHGDCWNNNMLFRYNSEGLPVEVAFVDLQFSREASIASDLNYFLQTSVTGDVRRPNIDNFMSIYHSAYKEVLEGRNMPMPFTKEEILEEFKDKSVFGLLFAMVIIPLLLIEPEEGLQVSDTCFETRMREIRVLSVAKLKTNLPHKSRFLAVFDELMEIGLIS